MIPAFHWNFGHLRPQILPLCGLGGLRWNINSSPSTTVDGYHVQRILLSKELTAVNKINISNSPP